MKIFDDTIAAISTPIGTGGIGIVRLSGDDSLKILGNIFSHKPDKFLSHHVYHGFIIGEENEIIDEVLVTIMLAPKTYTREDVVEINCHGGLLCVNQVLAQVLKNGARLAQPGEFTKRAYLNGRIDLLQAQAVIDIINSKTNLSKKVALRQLSGNLSNKIKSCMQQILDILAQIEAAIDYPEEYESTDVAQKINLAAAQIKKLIDSADTGKIIHDGIEIAIIGKPNVGKSSLLNRLCEKDCAIVTNVPGTTRDIIHEYINMDGIAAKILDTAGMHDTNDSIENLGIEKAKTCAENADVILLVLDGSNDLDDDDKNLLQVYNGSVYAKKLLFVVNKMDLGKKINTNDLPEDKIIEISAQKNLGVDILKAKIKNMVLGENVFDKNNEEFICNVRHKSSLTSAYNSLGNALRAAKENIPDDLLSIDLRQAYDFLGEITGESVSDKIVYEIFSKFCVGK